MGVLKGFDPLNRRRFDKGLDYEFNPNTHPSNGLVEHKSPELPQSGLIMLNLQNQERQRPSLVPKSFSGGLSGEAYGKVATGIRGMLDAAGKREMNILRRMADGMTQVADKILAMNAIFLSEEEVIRVTNREFVKVKREDPKGQFRSVLRYLHHGSGQHEGAGSGLCPSDSGSKCSSGNHHDHPFGNRRFEAYACFGGEAAYLKSCNLPRSSNR